MNDTNKGQSKSDKFNRAVDAARNGGEVQTLTTADVSTLNVDGSGAMVTKFSEADMAEMTKLGWEFAPQLRTLEQGDMIAGILEGNGPEAEFHDDIDKEIRFVKTWIISSPDGTQRASILSSAQLDRKLEPFIGGPIRIVRGKDLKTSNGHRVTDYMVAGPRLDNGKRRQWATLPAAQTHHALPPGTIDANAAQIAPGDRTGHHTAPHGNHAPATPAA